MNDTSPDVTEDVVSTDTTDGVTSPAVEAETTDAQNQIDGESNPEPEKTRGQIRIEQAVAQKNVAEQAKQAAIDYGNHYKSMYDDIVKKDTPVVVEPTMLAKPTLEECDFDQDVFMAKYDAYHSQHSSVIAGEAVSKALDQRDTNASKDKLDSAWNHRVSKFVVDHPDFNKVAFATKEIYSVIKHDDKGPDIAYALGEDPDAAERIGRLSGNAQIMAIGEFKSGLAKKPAVKTETTSAPDPMTTVGSTATTTPSKDESMADYVARRTAEQTARKRA